MSKKKVVFICGAFLLLVATACNSSGFSNPDLAGQQTQVALQQTQVALQQTQIALQQLPTSLPPVVPQATNVPVATVEQSQSISLTPTQPAPHPLPTIDSSIPSNGVVSFVSPNDPNQLNYGLGWQPGGSNANTYDLFLNPGALTIIAGTGTDQWGNTDSAPLITYPISGDFETQVKLLFTPNKSIHIAGLGVRSSQAHNTWLRIGRHLDGNCGGDCVSVLGDQSGSPQRLKNTSYTSEVIWLKIERYGPLFTLSYSATGNNWITLEKDFVFDMSPDTEIFLTAFSILSDNGVMAQFQDFIVIQR
jgi:regulation of enolase protein 1 (concanavalin A-like superfamily)